MLLTRGTERRIEATQVEDKVYYHMDNIIGEGGLRALERERGDEEDEGEVPAARCSEASLAASSARSTRMG